MRYAVRQPYIPGALEGTAGDHYDAVILSLLGKSDIILDRRFEPQIKSSLRNGAFITDLRQPVKDSVAVARVVCNIAFIIYAPRIQIFV